MSRPGFQVLQGIFLAAWLLSATAGAADSARVLTSRCLFSRLISPRGHTVVEVPLDKDRIHEQLPDALGRYRTRSWLTHFIVDRFYRSLRSSLIPVEDVSIKSVEDLRKVFKPGQWYNIVIDENGLVATPTSEYDGDRFFPNSIGAKHMGMVKTGEKPRFAGSAFFDGQGTLYLTNESGTFKPAGTTLPAVATLLQLEIPGLTVHTFERTPPEEFDRRVMARFENHNYKQQGASMIDPMGDAVLLGQMGKQRKYANPANKDEWAEVYKKERENRRGIKPAWMDGYEIGVRKAIIPHRLVNAFHQVILDHPEFKPYLGPTPKWSPQAFEFLKGKLPFSPIVPSKLFMAMVLGRSADFTPTGLEKDLEAKLLTFPDKSLQMHDVFREAYVLAKGDVTKALLAAENVLAKDSGSPDRDNTPLTKKLSYIRNDSKELGDNYGAWYHTFGMMLYQMEHPHWMGYGVAMVEAQGSSLYTLHDKQEQNANFIGVDAGVQLRALVESGRANKPMPGNARTDYMNLVEFPKTNANTGTGR